MKASFQSSPCNVPAGRDNVLVVPNLALKARGQIEGIYTASHLMQPRSLALLVEQEIQ